MNKNKTIIFARVCSDGAGTSASHPHHRLVVALSSRAGSAEVAAPPRLIVRDAPASCIILA